MPYRAVHPRSHGPHPAGCRFRPGPRRFEIFLLAALCLAVPMTARGLDWQNGAGYRSAPLKPSGAGKVGFVRLDQAQTGIAFTNQLSDAKAAENQIRLIGSGVALGDVDGDGWTDIYLCCLEGSNALFRNLGQGKFEDITRQSGVACADQYSTGATLADLDGDQDLDLLVNSIGGGTRCFFNGGQGRFAEATNNGLLKKLAATSLALGDVDGDGDLDLYVANYRTSTIRSTGLIVLNVDGRRVIRPEDRDEYEFTREGFLLEHGEVDAFYLNDGRGGFSQVPWTGGAFRDEEGKALASGLKDWGLSVHMRDVNGDRAPDIYVCNDFWSPDRFWLNDGRGRFQAIPRLALRNSSTFSMGVDFADLNRDGWDDFLVLDMMSRDHGRRMRQRAMLGQNFNQIGQIDDRPQVERNTLFLNRGDGTYAEVAQLSGVQASEWSWALALVDVDLDGFEDALITTGHGFDTQDSDTNARIDAMGPLPPSQLGAKLLMYPRLSVPNVAFHNRGDLTFEEVGQRWGFDAVGVSHGLALGDLDNDGDLDTVVNNLNGAVGVYRNECLAPRVAVRLKGRAPNTRGLGAKIRLAGGSVPQSQEMIGGGRYLSGDDTMRVFACGQALAGLTIEVTWRSGSLSVVTNVVANRVYEVDETGAVSSAPAVAEARPPHPSAKPVGPGSSTLQPFNPSTLFQDASTALGHLHSEPPFDDFKRQGVLSRRLSQLGPGVAWCDLEGDGWDDLVIGSGRGGDAGLYRNRGDGRFARLRSPPALSRLTDDLSAVVSWAWGPGSSTLLVGQGNYETGDSNQPSVLRYEIWTGGIEPRESMPSFGPSAGPLAAADVDGDGDLDLFVGGRVWPGRYPVAAPSRWYRNESRKFRLAQEWPSLGLVSGAVFSDLTGDGLPELVLACEWGPLKIYRNAQGQLTPWNAPVEWPGSRLTPHPSPLTLQHFSGWWNGVTAGDFDGDGRMDLAASNWGRNSPYQEYLKDEIRILYGDLAGHGGVEAVEAYFDPVRRRVVPWRDLDDLEGFLPWMRERFTTYASFAEATLEQVLGSPANKALEWRVNWLDSTIFLNRDDGFEAHPLPLEAQLAPAFGISAGDLDGDGAEDLFLSQNFFAVEEKSSRYDAGRGLWLKGNGQGGFAAVHGRESGVQVYGEQRGTALGDYDRDGRVDVVVSQNGAATRLLRNAGAKPGLRVRLRGAEGNLSSIGAVLRLHFSNRLGPAREIHGGSGYWSQDSTVQVLGYAEWPTALSVRWPGGRASQVDVPKGAREVLIDSNGKLSVLSRE